MKSVCPVCIALTTCCGCTAVCPQVTGVSPDRSEVRPFLLFTLSQLLKMLCLQGEPNCCHHTVKAMLDFDVKDALQTRTAFIRCVCKTREDRVRSFVFFGKGQKSCMWVRRKSAFQCWESNTSRNLCKNFRHGLCNESS